MVVVRNLNKRIKLNEKLLKKIIKEILDILKECKNKELEVIFLSDVGIRPLNKRYKHRDRATDVLSFNLGETLEVIISSDRALKNCRKFNTSFEDEIVLYVIHGILHLFGYDDESAVARKKMRKKESFVMERLCAKIRLSKVLTQQ